MLSYFRRHTKIIIWLVVFAFMGWGGFAVGTQFKNEGRVAGKVFGKNVYFQEYNAFYRSTQIFSSGPEPITNPEILRMRTWQNIILSREAQQKHIKVSDEEIRKEIFRLLKQQNIENPSMELYEKWLKATINESPKDFEEKVRELLRIQKLVSGVTEIDLVEPNERELYKQFLREYNSLSIQMIPFDEIQDAEALHETIQSPADWEKAVTDHADQVRSTGKISLDAVINLWKIPEEDATRLHGMQIGDISEPTPMGEKYAVIRIEDKTEADPDKFTEELKEKYKQKSLMQQRNAQLIQWGQDLQTRAQLQDLLPKPNPEPSSE